MKYMSYEILFIQLYQQNIAIKILPLKFIDNLNNIVVRENIET